MVMIEGDVVARLRDYAAHTTEDGFAQVYPTTLVEAASEIERLRRLLARAWVTIDIKPQPTA